MATRKKSNTRKRTTRRRKPTRRGLSGTVTTARKNQVVETLKEGGLILLSAIAAGGAGAAVGKHSLVVGLPVTLYGIYKKNNYITAGGLGLVLSNGFQIKKAAQTTEGIGALDFKQLTSEAKDRVTTFFKNFGDKLYIAPSNEGTSGLGEGEEVTYFINPFNNELDTSAMDRIQEQIAEMSRPGDEVSDFGEFHREF